MRMIDGDALEREGWSLHRTFQEDKNTMVYEVKKPYDFPTIEERKTGKWIWVTEDKYRCSECNQETRVDEIMGAPMYACCPYCKADMTDYDGNVLYKR